MTKFGEIGNPSLGPGSETVPAPCYKNRYLPLGCFGNGQASGLIPINTHTSSPTNRRTLVHLCVRLPALNFVNNTRRDFLSHVIQDSNYRQIFAGIATILLEIRPSVNVVRNKQSESKSISSTSFGLYLAHRLPLILR
jgi:hypothetical protein